MKDVKKEKLPYYRVFLLIYLPYLAVMTLLGLTIPRNYFGADHNLISIQSPALAVILLVVPVTFPIAFFFSSSLVRVKALKLINASAFGVTKKQRQLKWDYVKEVHTKATMSFPELEFNSSFSPQCLATFARWRERYLELARPMFEVTAMPDKEVTRVENGDLLLQLEEKAKKLESAMTVLQATNDEYWEGKEKPEYKGTPAPTKVEEASEIQFEYPIDLTSTAAEIRQSALKGQEKKRLWVPPSPWFNVYMLGFAMLVTLVVMVICAYHATAGEPTIFATADNKKPLYGITLFALSWSSAIAIGIVGIPGYFINMIWRQSKRNRAEASQLQRIMTSVTESASLLGLEVELTAGRYPAYAETIRARYQTWADRLDKAQNLTGFGDDTRDLDNEKAYALARQLRLEANSLWRVRQMIEGDVLAWRQELSWWSQTINNYVKLTVSAENSTQAIAALKQLDHWYRSTPQGLSLRGFENETEAYLQYANKMQICGCLAKQERRENLITLPSIAPIEVADGVLSAFHTSEKYTDMVASDKNYSDGSFGQTMIGGVALLIYLATLLLSAPLAL